MKINFKNFVKAKTKIFFKFIITKKNTINTKLTEVKKIILEKELLRIQKKDAKKVIIFNNSPITNSKEDAFDFKTKALAIKKAIDNKANIIALIGDYGAGKSSLIKILYKQYHLIFRRPIFVNLWDCVIEKEKLEKPDIDDKDDMTTYFTKSFLYQLSSKNKKKSSFSRYINQRLSKNYGKLSFSISTKWSVFFFF